MHERCWVATAGDGTYVMYLCTYVCKNYLCYYVTYVPRLFNKLLTLLCYAMAQHIETSGMIWWWCFGMHRQTTAAVSSWKYLVSSLPRSRTARSDDMYYSRDKYKNNRNDAIDVRVSTKLSSSASLTQKYKNIRKASLTSVSSPWFYCRTC